jgi:hypothetical protein
MTDSQPTLTVHDLRVTLLDVSPPIWRQVRVPSVVTLGVLHPILQIAMGWEDRHLHEWRVDDVIYGPPDEEDWGDDLADETSVLLGEVAPADASLTYVYDLGDEWQHLVEVTDVERYDARVPPVACLGGARACPPEDIGGPSGYEHLLDALTDPDDSQHDEMVELLGDSWHPDDFDPARVDRALEALWRTT